MLVGLVFDGYFLWLCVCVHMCLDSLILSGLGGGDASFFVYV